ncbi:potassium-transporting ATPase subunit F [Tautonia sp. JC769]
MRPALTRRRRRTAVLYLSAALALAALLYLGYAMIRPESF